MLIAASAGALAAGPAPTADVVDASRKPIPAAYREMAAQMSREAGIAYRYGTAATYEGAAPAPTLFARDKPTRLGAPAPDHAFFWQVGGPPSSDPGAYSSNWAQLLFVADDPAQRVGVSDVQVSNYMYNTFAQLPQLSWTRTMAPGGGIDQVNVLGYKTAGIVSGNPVATGRCAGRPGFCSQSVIAFQNGVIASAGSNTSTNSTTVKLPPDKVPTAIAMTNDSEFALVTVWDTTALKGQVAVVALAGLCDGCDPYHNGTNGARPYYPWWDEWHQAYPGLPNMGDIAFMKILGYIDLPGMAAPTEIAVTTGLDQFSTTMGGGHFIGESSTPLSRHWREFVRGGPHYERYAKGGMAVVISKSEQKAAFIDLKPLFSYLNGIYFSEANGQVDKLGPADDQWPYAFARQSAQMPKVVKTISLGARPTAVKTTVSAKSPRAWIATEDGTLHIFSIDGYAPGGTPAAPSAAAIAEVGSVGGIGRNATSMATSKGDPDSSVDTLNQQVIVASRGDRKVSWVRFAPNGNSGQIVRTLRDSRLVDPIAIEDADNFANPGFVVSVSDYGGKAVRNYRYGPVTFSDGGSCARPKGCPLTPTGSIAIEYAGAMSLPGKPFQLTTANTP